MASFQSTITAAGVEAITKALALGQELPLVRAAAGSGRLSGEKNQASALVQPLAVEVNIAEKQFIESNPSYLLLPIYIRNQGLTEAVYIREVMVYALDTEGKELPFAYSWLDGEDTDNILPATRREDGASDTAHIHELELLATDQINAVVQIEVNGGSWVTAAQMEKYAVKKPQADGSPGQFLRRTAEGTEWAGVIPDTMQTSADYIEGEDLNTYTERGRFFVAYSDWARTELNFPLDGVRGVLDVFDIKGVDCIQIYRAYTKKSSYMRLFMRHCYKKENFWSAWNEFFNLNVHQAKLPPQFDNLLAWPGCKRITPPKNGSTWTERIVTKNGNLLRAQRVTVITSESDVTETYTFYAEDGQTLTEKYTVRSTKDGTETWTEDVTKEAVT